MKEKAQGSEKAKKIVEKIRELSARPAVFITRKQDVKPALTDSKLGGLPYWDVDKDFPVDSNGEKMMLLAQINFSDVRDFDVELPKEGILQFFIRTDDDVYGMDFDEPAAQKDFRVIFHDTVRPDVTEEQIAEMGIKRAEEEGEYSPIFCEAALAFRLGTDYINPEVAGFGQIFAQAVKSVTGEDIGEEMSSYQYFDDSDDDFLYEELSGEGHKMLGYPTFTQSDPREYMEPEKAERYDTILLQIDSDMENGEDYVLWGDCGVANFFMSADALKRKDFSDVLYNWDCC